MINKNIKIQVNFQADTEWGLFSDALYFTPTEYEALTEEDLTAMQNERVANFVQSIKDSQVVVEPTDEELLAEKTAIEQQIAQLEDRKEDIVEQISDTTDNVITE